MALFLLQSKLLALIFIYLVIQICNATEIQAETSISQDNFSEDIFNIEDTTKQVNIYEKIIKKDENINNKVNSSQLFNDSSNIETKNKLSEISCPITYSFVGNSNTDCSKYCEFILQETILDSLPRVDNFVQPYYNLLKDLSVGLKVRWSELLKYFYMYLEPLNKNKFINFFSIKYLTNINFNKRDHKFFFGIILFFSLSIYFLLIKNKYNNKKSSDFSKNNSNKLELIENMLKRINWLCEQKTKNINITSDSSENNLENYNLQKIQNILVDMDNQLQNLDRFASILTQLFSSLENDIQSLIKERREFHNENNPQYLSNFIDPENYRFTTESNNISNSTYNLNNRKSFEY